MLLESNILDSLLGFQSNLDALLELKYQFLYASLKLNYNISEKNARLMRRQLFFLDFPS